MILLEAVTEAIKTDSISPLLVGIIGAASAIIGGLVTGFFSLGAVKKQIEHQKSSELRNERKELYISLCQVLFVMTKVLDNMNIVDKYKSFSNDIEQLEKFQNEGYARFALFINDDIKPEFNKMVSLYVDSLRMKHKSEDFNEARDKMIKMMHADMNYKS